MQKLIENILHKNFNQLLLDLDLDSGISKEEYYYLSNSTDKLALEIMNFGVNAVENLLREYRGEL